MAELVGNSAYISWNGTQVDTYWAGEISYNPSVNLIDTSSGSGQDYVKRDAGLKTIALSLELIFDDTTQTYFTDLPVGTKGTLIWGPQGNAVGKPKFECPVIIESVTLGQQQTKGNVRWQVSFQSTGVPTATIEGGDTF